MRGQGGSTEKERWRDGVMASGCRGWRELPPRCLAEHQGQATGQGHEPTDIPKVGETEEGGEGKGRRGE